MGEDDLAPAIRAKARAEAIAECAKLAREFASRERRHLCYLSAEPLDELADRLDLMAKEIRARA